MTVGELIKELSLLPVNLEVVLQKDSEGNGFSPLDSISANCIYQPETTWSGDVLSSEWDHVDAGFETEAQWLRFKLDNPRCVVLAPIN